MVFRGCILTKETSVYIRYYYPALILQELWGHWIESWITGKWFSDQHEILDTDPRTKRSKRKTHRLISYTLAYLYIYAYVCACPSSWIFSLLKRKWTCLKSVCWVVFNLWVKKLCKFWQRWLETQVIEPRLLSRTEAW